MISFVSIYSILFYFFFFIAKYVMYSHDLKGASQYFRLFLSQIQQQQQQNNSAVEQQQQDNMKTIPRVPMQAVMDYLGYRVTAMPLLPLQELVYGSADAGDHIELSDESVNKKMEEAAKVLHLAPHNVRIHSNIGNNQQAVTIHSAIDVEVHHGKDGRIYLLDLARTFPCEVTNHN